MIIYKEHDKTMTGLKRHLLQKEHLSEIKKNNELTMPADYHQYNS